MKGGCVLLVAAVLLLCVLPYAIAQAPTQLAYNLNTQYVYSVAGVVDSRGLDVTSGDRTPGSLGYLTSTMVMEPTQVGNDSYMFVMNMFNTVVSVDQNATGAPADGSNPLGYDMYFQQKFTGEIVQIWYNTADSPFYVNVKIASINSFQTSMVGVGSQVTISESDPIGVHTANVAGAAGASAPLVLSKTFNQADVSQFVDTELTSQNVNINAAASVSVHNAGYVIGTTVQQLSTLVNSGSQSKRDLTNSTGFDMDLSSQGHLTHTLLGVQAAPAKTYKLVVTLPTNYAKSTMFEVSTKNVAFAKAQANTMPDFTAKLITSLKTPTLDESVIAVLSKVAKHLKYNPKDASILIPFMAGSVLNSDAMIRDKVFFVLSAAQHSEYIAKFGLSSAHPEVRRRAVLACASLENPTHEIVEALHELAEETLEFIPVYGIVVGNAKNAKHGKKLLKNMKEAMEDNNVAETIAWVNAVGNAGPAAVEKPQKMNDVFDSENSAVRASAVYALRKFANSANVQNMLQTIVQKETDPAVAKVAASMLKAPFELAGSDYPFNKTFSKDINIGGKVADVVFEVDAFAGTNFNCNQNTFNYDVSAQASATASLFGQSKQAFLASAIYGKDNGTPLDDLIQVTVWGNVIYSQAIPSVDCSEHTYPLAHAAPGFSVSYTLWVSIVPVVFTASVNLQLDLSWGWQVCDSDLSAMVELIPTGALVVDGSVTVDLLLLRAGLELSASFTDTIKPQLYIHGSECEVGFDVEEDSQPMSAQFDSFYMWRECKYWIFDCTWGPHNQQTWWSWSRPAQTNTIYNQDWKITP